MNQVLSIAKKELKTYFGSPMAALFIGAFLLATLFSFFWLETFFSRNTADIRPLFRWMPLLMVFLVSALTMRQWSEEQRMGTMEILMTLPVKFSQLVVGKFLAVLTLVAVALVLTLGLPLTVSLLGNMDWGPVIGGYLGALLMASAYIAIGLFISSKTDNQIVALILTVMVAGFLYMLGSTGITNFMGNSASELFRSLGTGSRFASIERGVIDLRDLVYYLSLTIFFLMMNVLSLDRKRWSIGENTISYRRTAVISAILITLNLFAVNVWLQQVNSLRLDLTENQEYSLSATSRNLLANIQEPLILRGYFSEKTHPLLSPLVPRIKDLMEEYAIASKGQVEVSFIDPKYDEEMEAEANQQYAIKPVPFQIAGRYEASVINSYFNILIKYGDQHITLGFNDIIEIQPRNDGQIDVKLRNLEYDLTKSIKKVVYGFQSLATVFESINKDITLTSIITKGSLPEPLAAMPAQIDKVVSDLKKESMGKLKYQSLDPDVGSASREDIDSRFNIKPMAVSFFSQDTFYLYLLLTIGDNSEQIYLSGDMGEAEIRKEIEAVLKRNSSGFLKTIGMWTPNAPVDPQVAMMQQQAPRDQYQAIQQVLPENYNLEKVDLSSGRIPGEIDVLLLAAPQEMSDIDRFAVDQYLMRGGAVVALAGNYLLDLNPYAKSLNVKKAANGLSDLLTHYGIRVGDSLVMDQQNEPFPVPVSRDIGGFAIQEIRQISYPFFVDVRADGMDKESPVLASLPAVTMNWVSPLTVDQEKNKGRKLVNLLKSSSNSWLYEGSDIQPDFQKYPEQGFAGGTEMQDYVLAVSVQGSFSSFFSEKPDPRENVSADEKNGEDLGDNPSVDENKEDPAKAEKQGLPKTAIIKKSPESSRLVVVGSSEFINDTVISISQSMSQDRFLNSLGFIQNIVDWAVEDEELLVIRSRGSNARLLIPMSRQEQTFWEWLNYGIAFLALIVVSIYGGMRRRKEQPFELIEVRD
jgi:ABC-2 type transport system permease protein